MLVHAIRFTDAVESTLALRFGQDHIRVCILWSWGRAHIVPAVFMHQISEYGNKEGGVFWEEMWLPDDEPPTARVGQPRL